jgi:hypothetical protein
MFKKYFKKAWVMPVGSGGSVIDKQGDTIQPEGTWDLLYVKAEQ